MVECEMHICFLDARDIAPPLSEKIYHDVNLLHYQKIDKYKRKYSLSIYLGNYRGTKN